MFIIARASDNWNIRQTSEQKKDGGDPAVNGLFHAWIIANNILLVYNKSMKKRILLIALAVIVLAAAVVGGYNMIIMSRLRSLTLESARWFCGGGMNGGHTSIDIRRDGDHAVAVTESQEWHNSDLEKVTYTLPLEVMDQIKDLIAKNNLNALSRRGYSKTIALDADTSSFSCFFKEGYGFSVSQNQKKTAAESKRFYEVRDLLYSLVEGVEGVKETLPGDQVDSFMNMESGSGLSGSTDTLGNFRKLCEPVI